MPNAGWGYVCRCGHYARLHVGFDGNVATGACDALPVGQRTRTGCACIVFKRKVGPPAKHDKPTANKRAEPLPRGHPTLKARIADHVANEWLMHERGVSLQLLALREQGVARVLILNAVNELRMDGVLRPPGDVAIRLTLEAEDLAVRMWHQRKI